MSKMTDIKLSEVSGVDYPAHLVHGFAVMKSADKSKNEALIGALRKENKLSDKTVADLLKELSADDIVKALSDEQRAEFEKAFPPKKKVLPEDLKDGGADDDQEDEDGNVKKAVHIVKAQFEAEIAKRDAEIAEVRKTAEFEKAARLDQAAIQKSKDAYTNLAFDHDAVAPALRKFAEVDSAAAESIETMLKAVNEQADGTIFKQLGTDREGAKVEKSAWDQIEDKATELAKSESIPFAKALQRVTESNPDLVAAHFKGDN